MYLLSSHPFSTSIIYYCLGCQFLIDGIALVQTTDHEMIPAFGGLAGVSGAVRGTAGFRWDCWTDLVGATRNENIQQFE